MQRERETKPMLKQLRIDGFEGAKKHKRFGFKVATVLLAVMVTIMLASCIIEITDPEQQSPIIDPEPSHSEAQVIEYKNRLWHINLTGFSSEEKAEAAAELLSNNVENIFSVDSFLYNEERLWTIRSSCFDIDQIYNLSFIAEDYKEDTIYVAVYGPCESIELSNLTLEEFKNVYSHMDVSWGDISISQEQSPNNAYNIGYTIKVENIKKTEADALQSLVSDQTKIKTSHNSRKVFTGESNVYDAIDIFNVNVNDLTATYVDNYGSVDSFLSVIGEDLSNTKITRIIDVDGQKIATHATDIWKLSFDGFSATMVFCSDGSVQYSSTSENTNEQGKVTTQVLEKNGSYTAISDTQGTITFMECHSTTTVDGVVTRSSPYSESWTYELLQPDGSIRIVCQDYNATITLDKK